MIPAHFKYHAPTDLEQVFSLMSEFGSKAKILAGGHSLLPMMKFRFAEPGHLIDLGTVSGNDQPSVMLALDASFELVSKAGSRLVKADQFFFGTYQTALQSDEILTKIIIPRATANRRCGFRKLKRKTGDFATAACALTLTLEGNQCSDVRIALTNLGPKSFRAEHAEWLLNSQPLSEDSIKAAVQLAMQVCEPAEDQRGNSEYKIKMAGEMLKRALSDAIA